MKGKTVTTVFICEIKMQNKLNKLQTGVKVPVAVS